MRNFAIHWPTILYAAAIVSSPLSAQDYPYKSLEEFCIATGADTPANCACGQATADELLSEEEKRLILGLMLRNATAMAQISELYGQEALMGKLAKITKGCA